MQLFDTHLMTEPTTSNEKVVKEFNQQALSGETREGNKIRCNQLDLNLDCTLLEPRLLLKHLIIYS